MIVILDYGMGNPGSILNMVRRAGGSAVVSSDLDIIASASAIILPGVGSFNNGITKLKQSGILALLEKKVMDEKIPFLGICLGMQLLFDKSEEGDAEGLGWIPGFVKKFDISSFEETKRLKIPHMGWNLVTPKEFETLYKNMEEEARFYFVHSYHVVCAKQEHILATTNYGYEFVSSVRNNNIWGAQFHPEKSHRFGLMFFRNFLKEAKCLEQE